MVCGGQNETTSLILVNFVLLPFSPLSTASPHSNWTNGGKGSAERLTLDILCWVVQRRMANFSHSTSEIWY
eukprot:scaffold5447_cov73-Skeletonema_marinoi.AAC.1